MNFKEWLNNDFSHWKNILLGYLDLDRRNGLSQTLDTMNTHNLQAKLQGLGEFAKLPLPDQQRVLGFIERGQGTIGDLIRQISGD